MKKFLLAFLIHIIFFHNNPSPILAQSLIDSLKSELYRAKEDTNKVWLYKVLSIEMAKTDVDTAIKYGKQGLELAQRISFKKGIASHHNNIGIWYKRKGFYEEAFEHFNNSLRIKEKLNDKKGMASTLNNIGNIFDDLGEFRDALEHYDRSLEIYEELKDTLRIAIVTLNIGTVYHRQKKYGEALINYQKSLEIFQVTNDLRRITTIHLNYGDISMQQGNLEEAKDLFFNSLEISKKITDKERVIKAYNSIGSVFIEMQEYDSANFYLHQAFKMAGEVGLPRRQSDAAKSLSQSYRQLNLPIEALYYNDLYTEINDSLRRNKMAKILAVRQVEIEMVKEREISFLKLKREKLIRYFSMIAFGLALVLAFVIFRNYRIKNKANRLLAEMDQLKSRLFSNISHEFRTPLTLILGPIEEMLSKTEKKPTRRKAVKMMQRNANRLLNLVNQMLDLSKLDAGSLKLELVEKDIVKFLRVSILSFASLAEKKKINFIHKLPDEKLTTWYDPDKLEKILNNLLSNAFKFTPEGGEVKCEVKLPDPGKNLVEILVQDTGKGIPADQLDRIFNRFHQVEGSHEPKSTGTGIGLSLTKELVNLLHGGIKVESELGKGTTFIVQIPVGKEHLKESEYTIEKREKIPKPAIQADLEVVTEEEECPEGLYEGTKPEEEYPLVLTVEDHADIRIHIREHLEDSFRIMEAEDGVMGLDKAVENIPDLIITDLIMPKMDGVEMCKKLKTDERTSHIPVIMLTAKASVEDRLEGLETGADAYVTKPFNIKELEVRVRKLIEQRKKLRERFSREITLEPKDIAITSADEKFLQRAMAIVEDHMADFEFEVRNFQDEIGMSRMQLFRKLKAITDQTPSEFIRTLRLKRAAKLIEQKFGNIAQITYEVGFNNLSYFAKCFKELYGVLPSEYKKQA